MKSRGLKKLYYAFNSVLFDPVDLLNKWRGLPYYFSNLFLYSRLKGSGDFGFSIRDAHYSTKDRFSSAGSARGHYFYQDIWAARKLYEAEVKEHIDVGSRLDGFIGHILPFCRVTYVDIRPLKAAIPNLEFVQGSILDLPFEDNSVNSISSLHVIEHIGLGRYGDPVDPDGYLKAAAELSRVLAPGGRLIIGTPVGRQRLCFDAHRVFDYHTVLKAFETLRLAEFSLIDDGFDSVTENASPEQAAACEYGCGLFIFTKDDALERQVW